MWFKLKQVLEDANPMDMVAVMAARILPGMEDIKRDQVYVMHPAESPVVNVSEGKEVTIDVMVAIRHSPVLFKLDVIETPKGKFITDKDFELQVERVCTNLENAANKKYSHLTVDLLQMMCRHTETSPLELDFDPVEVKAMSIPEPLKKVWIDYLEAKQKFSEFTSTW